MARVRGEVGDKKHHTRIHTSSAMSKRREREGEERGIMGKLKDKGERKRGERRDGGGGSGKAASSLLLAVVVVVVVAADAGKAVFLLSEYFFSL